MLHSGSSRAPVLSISLLLALPAAASATQGGPIGSGGIIGHPPMQVNQTWPDVATPPGNPLTKAKIRLGKALFWEEQLSSDNTMSCGTCHLPEAGGTEFRQGQVHPLTGQIGSLGMVPQRGTDYIEDPDFGIDRRSTNRHAPTMIGAAFFELLFWDNRASDQFRDANGVPIPSMNMFAALESQAVEPPISPVEMGHDNIDWHSNEIQKKLADSLPLKLATQSTIPPDVMPLVTSGYRYERIFDDVFALDPTFGGSVGVTRERIAVALASYQRTLIPNRAPIDTRPLTHQEFAGMENMRNVGCFGCHSVTRDPQLRPTGGLVNPFDSLFSDGIRHAPIGLPGPGAGFGAKTPTLRNVALRQRFFHSGEFSSLNAILDHYDSKPPPLGFGGTLMKAEVTAFLHTLTDPRVPLRQHPFDRPQLASERNPFEQNEYGSGTPGTGGLVPETIANAPPVHGNAYFKLGVGQALPHTTAHLSFSLSQGPGPVLIGPATSTITTATDLNGVATAKSPIANDPNLIGLTLFTQWFVQDPNGGFGGFSLSNGAIVGIE